MIKSLVGNTYEMNDNIINIYIIVRKTESDY